MRSMKLTVIKRCIACMLLIIYISSCGLPPFNSELQGELVFLGNFSSVAEFEFRNTQYGSYDAYYYLDFLYFHNPYLAGSEGMLIIDDDTSPNSKIYGISNVVSGVGIQNPRVIDYSSDSFNASFSSDTLYSSSYFDLNAEKPNWKILPMNSPSVTAVVLTYEDSGPTEITTVPYALGTAAAIDGTFIIDSTGTIVTSQASMVSIASPATFQPLIVAPVKTSQNQLVQIGRYTSNSSLAYILMEHNLSPPTTLGAYVSDTLLSEQPFSYFSILTNPPDYGEYSLSTGLVIISNYSAEKFAYESYTWNSFDSVPDIVKLDREGFVEFMFSTGDALFRNGDERFLRKANGEYVDLDIGRVIFLYEEPDSGEQYVYFQSKYPLSAEDNGDDNVSIVLRSYREKTSEVLEVLYNS